MEETKDKLIEDTSISKLGLSTRLFNCLTKAGVTTIEQIIQMSDDEIRNIKNVGEKSFNEIIKAREEYLERTNKQEEKEEIIEEPQMTELEMLKDRKSKLKIQLDDLMEKTEKAKELLAQFQRLTQDKEGRDVSED